MINQDPTSRPASRLGLVLSVLSVLIALISAIPSFLALRAREPHVVYSASRAQMLYPRHADRDAIKALLKERAIPDAYAELALSNRGDQPAKEVVVSLCVPGRIVAEQTTPAVEERPAWVSLRKDSELEKDPTRVRYILTDLGLARDFSIKVSYISQSDEPPTWEVFADGRSGLLVGDIGAIPGNARAISFVPAIKTLGVGLLLSLAAYIMVRFQVSIRSVAYGLPVLGLLLRQEAGRKWSRYKADVVYELGTDPRVTIVSSGEGDYSSSNPDTFWDAIIDVEGTAVGVDIRASAQLWRVTASSLRADALKFKAMSERAFPPLKYVVFVSDIDCWSRGGDLNPSEMFAALHSGVRFFFVTGPPQQAARVALELIRSPDGTVTSDDGRSQAS